MASPLLDTKFYAPQHRSGLVARPVLAERLDRGFRTKLTLVSAPAGFGKSTLVAEWLRAVSDAGAVTAWLSLDPSDNDPVTFWTQVIAALQMVAPGIGASARAQLEAPDSSVEAVLAPLLNDLNAMTTDVALVLDDYHVIDAPQVHAGMVFMVEHLPARVHIIITTRADPPLPLARLRARGELVEVRAADLRFTSDEASDYLNGVLALGLTERDLASLESRTEGWIAALQLAGLTMQGREDVGGFIADFAGDDRYIVDYLVEEVWHRQSDDVQDFLLQTSILARMCGPLCDAVTGQSGGKAMLEDLDRRNLFVIALDDRRRWFRYHHLFGDVLQARLLDERQELVPRLHRRAAEWYASQGETEEAIRHAIAGRDFDRAADLVELSIPEMGRDRRESVTRRWIESLPEESLRVRPVLNDTYAGTMLLHGESDGVEGRLDDAEHWLELTAESMAKDGTRPSSMIVADEAAFASLPASIAIHRAGLARMLGDDAATVAHAHRALGLLGDEEHLGRGGAAALLGLTYWAGGDLDAAHQSYLDAYASLERAGYFADLLGLAITLADIRIAQGRLSDAKRTYEQGLHVSAAHSVAALRGTADMRVGLSAIARERDDRSSAAGELAAAQELGEENGLPQNPYRSRVALARLRQSEGDLDGAIHLLDEAERLYDGDFSPDVRPVAATRVRVLLAAGRLSEASDWARDRGHTTSSDLAYLREYEHITLARVLLAQGSRDSDHRATHEVLRFVARLLAAAEDGKRGWSVIDILIVQALAYESVLETEAALGSLERALDLAEPEGYVRAFVDEGPPMARLLKLAARRSEAQNHARRLLAAMAAAGGRAASDQPLIEPLSERELEVLRLLESDLTGPDIARELSVSLPTVRTHTQNVYSKLGVTSRRTAVRRARELGLL